MIILCLSHAYCYIKIYLRVFTQIYFILRTCTSLDWDKDGDVLAVANDKNGMLYNAVVIFIKHVA